MTETITERCEAKGLRMTPQRLAILEALVMDSSHPTAEELHRKLLRRFPTMSLATVYRNVMLIKSLGEVLELGFPDGSNRYDGNKPHPHPHIVCLRCRKIIDLAKEVEKRGFAGLETEAGEVGGPAPEFDPRTAKPPPSTGAKTESYPNPRSPRSSVVIVPGHTPSAATSRPSGASRRAATSNRARAAKWVTKSDGRRPASASSPIAPSTAG